MIINTTELIEEQIKTVGVMFACGVVTETMWIAKSYGKNKLGSYKIIKIFKTRDLLEIVFWIFASVTLSMFMYYSTYGAITLHGTIGFLAGLLLWKKICCGILKTVWAEKEEVESLKTIARLSTLKRLENNDWKKGVLKRKKKKNV